jgi:uncharacterized protein YbjT (DUF2867 family)
MTETAAAHVVVAGATGLVGGFVIEELAARGAVGGVASVTALVRKATARSPSAVREVVFDFASEAAYARLGGEIPCDALLCCIGTTMKTAGSVAAFDRVDKDIPLALLRRLTAAGHGVLGLVSSVGADRPRGHYLEIKAEVERAVRVAGVPAVVVRPSLLRGPRQETRVGERVAEAVMVPLWKALGAVSKSHAIAKYAPIEARDVARALVAETLRLARSPGARPAGAPRVLEGRALQEAARQQ